MVDSRRSSRDVAGGEKRGTWVTGNPVRANNGCTSGLGVGKGNADAWVGESTTVVDADCDKSSCAAEADGETEDDVEEEKVDDDDEAVDMSAGGIAKEALGTPPNAAS